MNKYNCNRKTGKTLIPVNVILRKDLSKKSQNYQIFSIFGVRDMENKHFSC